MKHSIKQELAMAIQGFLRSLPFSATIFLGSLIGDAFSEVQALQWESIGPDGGRIDGFAQSRANPERMFVLLHQQGVWRSDDRGASWTRVDEGLPDQTYTAIAVSSFDPDLVILAPDSGDAVLRSTNGGVNWSESVVANGIGSVQDIEFDPLNQRNVLLTAGGVASVYKSIDQGESWALANVGFTASPIQIVFHPTNAGTVLIGSYGGGIFRSTNTGASWTASNLSGNVGGRSLSFCRSTPSRVWALSHPAPLLRSDDGGVTFVDSGAPSGFGGPESWCEMIAADPDNVGRIFGGFNSSFCTGDCTYFGFVRRTTNSGATWGDYFAPSGNYSFTEFVTGFDNDVDDESIAYMSLGDGYGAVPVGFIRTTDHGATWNSWMSGLHGRAIWRVDHDGTGKVYSRANARDGLWVAPSAGEAWTELPALQLEYYGWTDWQTNRGIDGLIEELGGHYSMDTFYATYRRSTDGGLNWTGGALPTPDVEGFCPTSYGTAVASDPISGQTVYVWVDACGNALCRSTNGGVTFDIVQVGGPATIDAKIDPTDPQRVFAMEWPYSGLVKLTTDGGVTWTPRSSGLPTGVPTGWGIALLMDSSNPDRLAAVYRTAGVYTTQNAGLSWSAVVLPGYNGQTIVDADWDPQSNRFFLAIENGGAYVSGAGFISQGAITSFPTSITYEPLSKKVLLGTQYASVSLLDIGSVVDAPFVSSAPQIEIAIHARPNPSRGQFDFDVHVGKEGSARITILDVRGRRVAVPFEGRLDQGRHSIHWQGDANDRIVPGIYFARIDAAGRSASTRLVILGQ